MRYADVKALRFQVMCAGAVAASRHEDIAETVASPFNAAWSEVDRVAPAVTKHPRITFATALLGVAGGLAYYKRYALVLLQYHCSHKVESFVKNRQWYCAQ